MANALYDAGRNKYLIGLLDWDGDTMSVILVDNTDYTVNLATDDFLDDVAAGAREEEASLVSPTADGTGVADATDTVFSATSGDACDSIIIWEDSGVDSTSDLIAYIDTAGGLPVTLGGDVTVQWDSGANKIFKL